MIKFLQQAMLAGVALLIAGGATARADSYNFNFNSLSVNANAHQIGTYMTGQLTSQGCIGCSVSVVGAVADRAYTGEGHVVGPSNGTGGYTPITLGNTDGATSNSSYGGVFTTNDTFLSNTKDNGHQVSTEFYMIFNLLGKTISGASFDFEIFPDGTANQPPDFTFQAGNGTAGSDPLVLNFGTNGVMYGVAGGTTDGANTHSPNSGSGKEASKQYIGTRSGSLNHATEIDFIDWPATIGIDNLVITTTSSIGTSNIPTSPVPEPRAIGLLAMVVLFSLFAYSRKRGTAAIQQGS